MGLGSETLKSRCWRSLPGPAHLLQASYPVLRVVAWQNDAAFPPLLPLVLHDDPQCLVLLAGFPPDPQHHPIAAPCLVLENHADSTLGQIDGGADEPSSLAFPPPAALQLQVIPDICSERKTPFSIIFCSHWQQVSHLLPSGFAVPVKWDLTPAPFVCSCSCAMLHPVQHRQGIESHTCLTSHHPLPGEETNSRKWVSKRLT